jgi:hypothetical protein
MVPCNKLATADCRCGFLIASKIQVILFTNVEKSRGWGGELEWV